MRLFAGRSLCFTHLEAGERPLQHQAWIFFPRAGAGSLLSSAPALCAGPGKLTLHPCWAAVFYLPFCSVSAQRMGWRNESGFFAVFYHLMMVIHRLLDCSHGNGSCFQHPQPLHTVLALRAKRVREARGATRWQGRAREHPLLQSCSLLLPPCKMDLFTGDKGGGEGGSTAMDEAPWQPWQGCGQHHSLSMVRGGTHQGHIPPLHPAGSCPAPPLSPSMCTDPANGSSPGLVMNPGLRKPAKQGRGASSDNFWSIPWSMWGTTICHRTWDNLTVALYFQEHSFSRILLNNPLSKHHTASLLIV